MSLIMSLITGLPSIAIFTGKVDSLQIIKSVFKVIIMAIIFSKDAAQTIDKHF